MKVDVVVVGSINVDLVFSVQQLPKPGETVGGAAFAVYPGGKGANQAVAAARMGAATALIGCVGQDEYGSLLLSALREADVDCSRVQVLPGASGCAGILVDNRGTNCIAVAGGANFLLSPAQVLASKDLIAGARVLLTQLEVPLPAVKTALEIARKAGVVTILDPAPAMHLNSELLALVDYITPNRLEASRLTGIDVHCWSSAAQAARELRCLGVGNALVTMGQLGAFLSSSAGEVRISPPHVQAVDSTAAGDAFNGALAAALVHDVQPDQAADIGAAAGALSAARPGAQPSLPTLAEVAHAVTLPW